MLLPAAAAGGLWLPRLHAAASSLRLRLQLNPRPPRPTPQASAFRILEQAPPAHGVAVAAPTMGGTVSAKLRLPLPKGSRVAVPRCALGAGLHVGGGGWLDRAALCCCAAGA